jgi:hypothetical protein
LFFLSYSLSSAINDDDDDDDAEVEVEVVYPPLSNSVFSARGIFSAARRKLLGTVGKSATTNEAPPSTKGNPYKSLNDIVDAAHVSDADDDEILANFALFQVGNNANYSYHRLHFKL